MNKIDNSIEIISQNIIKNHKKREDIFRKPDDNIASLKEAGLKIYDFELTEAGHSKRLYRVLDENYIWNTDRGVWLNWDGQKWKIINGSKMLAIATDGLAESIRREIKETVEEDKRRELLKNHNQVQKVSTAKAVLNITEGHLGQPNSKFDKDGYLLNTQNGILDLQSGFLKPHDKNYLITKIVNANYDKNAESPLWQEFLNSVFENDQELIDYMQKVCGLLLTGDASEQSIWFFEGRGRNGKGVFIRTLLHVLNDYATSVAPETFLDRKSDRASNDLAILAGKRFIATSETKKGTRLAEELIKQLTGGDEITCRFLFKEFFTYTPTFKIIAAFNHRPIITGQDVAIWDRIKIIPFNVYFAKEDRDFELEEKLKAEGDGILSWMVEGFYKWKAEGLKEPKAVKEATGDYKADMNPFYSFTQNHCVTEPYASATSKALYDGYKNYCLETGEIVESQTKLGLYLREAGFTKKKGVLGNVWLGIGLKNG